MGSRLSSHAKAPDSDDDSSSDDEILLVAPPPPPPPPPSNPRKALKRSSNAIAAAAPAKRPRVKPPPPEPPSPFLPPPLLDRKQQLAASSSSASSSSAAAAPTRAKSGTKRTLKKGSPPPPPRRRHHTRWTDDTATGGTIASISHATEVRAAAQSSPLLPEKEVVPDVAAVAADAVVSSATTTTTETATSKPNPAPSSKTKRKRVRSPSFELEVFNPPPSRRRATLSATNPPATPMSAPPPPPRSVPTSSTVAVLAPTRSTISPDEPNDDKIEQRASPAIKEVLPPASSSPRKSRDGDSLKGATSAVLGEPFELVVPVFRRRPRRTASTSGSGASSPLRPSPPPAGKKPLPSSAPTPTPTPLPFPHKPASHPLNSSCLRLKPTPSEPPPPIPVRFWRNDEFEATKGLGGWVMPHPVAAAAVAAAAGGIVVTGEGKGRKSRVSSASASSSRETSLSRSSTPLPVAATATATEAAATPAPAPARARPAAALSAAAWARKRYGFLDPSETSHYKIDGSILGIDPDVMSFEWDEEELWDAYEERWGWRERERVARGEEGASEEEESEGDEEEDEFTDDEDAEGSGSGSEEHQKRSSPPPPRARMAFTIAATTTEEEEEGSGGRLLIAGTEVVARLCHLASASEGAVHPSDRLSALSQLNAMSRQGGAVLQVPWRWKSLEEGQGRASNLAGMVDGKGQWATRNPFMRGTEQESGRRAHRLAKVAAPTTAVANTQGAGGMAGSSRPRAAAARRRILLSSSTSSSRAPSVDSEPAVNVSSSAAAAGPAKAAPPPLNVAAVTGALYGIDEPRGAALGSDMTGTGFDSAQALSVPSVAAPARQIPHLWPFFLSPSSASSSSLPAAAAAAESSPSSAAMRLETSSEGAAVIRSIHDISNANATSPLLSGGGALIASNPERSVATASSTIELTRRSRPEKPPTTVRSQDGVPSASTSRASSATTSASSSSNGNGSSSSSSSSSGDGDAADSAPTSASSSGPEAGPLTARHLHPPPPLSALIATARPLAPPVVPASSRPTAPAASSAGGSRTSAPKASVETPKKPPTVKRATTPAGMVRCNHGGCPSPFYHPHKRAAVENHARNFHTPGVTLNYRDPDRAHYLLRDAKTGALQCPFCSFWSMNASSTKQHVYRRSDCLGPPVQSRAD